MRQRKSFFKLLFSTVENYICKVVESQETIFHRLGKSVVTLFSYMKSGIYGKSGYIVTLKHWYYVLQ